MSKASRLKGHCNRLYAISELPAHQAQIWWRFSWLVWERGSIVRMRCFFLVLFLVVPVRVMAADAAPDQSAAVALHPNSNCGATIADALKQARASLASKDAASEHAVLECLIEAVNRIEAENLAAVRDGGNRMLTVPTSTAAVR